MSRRWALDLFFFFFWVLLYPFYRRLQLKDLHNDVKFDSVKHQEENVFSAILCLLFFCSVLFHISPVSLRPLPKENELRWPAVYFPAQLTETSDIQLRLSRPSFDSVPCWEGAFGLNTGHCNMIPWLPYWAIIALTHFIISLCFFNHYSAARFSLSVTHRVSDCDFFF